MAHGGSVESYEDTDGKAHEALDMESGRDLHPKQTPHAQNMAKQKYAEGGEVDAQRPLKTNPMGSNPEEDELDASVSMAPHEMVDADMRGAEDSSRDELDLPQVSENISLASQVMKDRKRRMMASGGKVKAMDGDEMSPMGSSSRAGSLGQTIDPSDDSYETNDGDEMTAPKEDGRDERGLNAEPVHTMEDDEHDTSDASLVAQILRDRKNRRR